MYLNDPIETKEGVLPTSIFKTFDMFFGGNLRESISFAGINILVARIFYTTLFSFVPELLPNFPVLATLLDTVKCSD